MNETIWRTAPYTVRSYIRIYKPPVVFSCYVNGTPTASPIASFNYDGATGTYGDVLVDSFVRISSGGVVKGYGRVRKALAAAVFYIGHVGTNEINIADNDFVEVYDDWRIQARIPLILKEGALVYKDYEIAYSDQNSKPNPVCVAGPDRAGFVDPDTNVLTCTFDLTDSYAVASGATISSYSGTVNNGTIVSGSIASGGFTVEFDPGEAYCHFTVTDSNGKTHTRHVYIYAAERTGANAPNIAKPDQLRATPEGWQLDFSLYEDASDLLPGAKVIMFVEERYGSNSGSLTGYAGAEAVKFVGWLTDKNTNIEPTINGLRLSATNATGVLQNLEGFAQTNLRNATPTNWQLVKALNLFRHIHYLLYWHSTVLGVCDLIQPDWWSDDTGHVKFTAPESTLFEQVSDKAWAVNAVFGTDRNGLLRMSRYANMLDDTDKTALATYVTLLSSDWSLIDIKEADPDDTFWVRGSAFLQSTSTEAIVMSIAPVTPGQAKRQDTLERQLVVDQTELNRRTGQQYAIKNLDVKRLNIDLTHKGAVADPVLGSWVKLTLAASTNKRGISYTNGRFVLKEVSVSFEENGLTNERWSLEPEASYVNATTVDVRVGAVVKPNYTKIKISKPIRTKQLNPIIKPATTFAQVPALYVFVGVGTVGYYRVKQTSAGVFTCTEIFRPVTDMAGQFEAGAYGFAPVNILLDPFAPKFKAYFVTEYFITSGANPRSRVYQINNIDVATRDTVDLTLIDSFTQYNQNSGGGGYRVDQLQPSVNINGRLFYASASTITNYLYVFDRDGLGDLFGGGFIGVSEAFNYLSFGVGKHASDETDTVLYLAGNYSATGVFLDGIKIYKSDDAGATWSLDETRIPEVGRRVYPQKIHVPKDSNADSSRAFFLFRSVDNEIGSGIFFYRGSDGVYNDIGFQNGGYYIQVKFYDVYDYNHNYLVCSGNEISGAAGDNLYKSSDKGATWAKVDGPTNGAGTYYYKVWQIHKYDYDIVIIDALHNTGDGAFDGLYYTTNFFSGSPPTWHLITLASNFVGGLAGISNVESVWTV